MSRRSSRTTSSTTTGKNADGGSNSDGEAKTDDGLAGAIMSEDVMLIDKIYAGLRLRSLDDLDVLDFRASLADCVRGGGSTSTHPCQNSYS